MLYRPPPDPELLVPEPVEPLLPLLLLELPLVSVLLSPLFVPVPVPLWSVP